MAEDFVRFLGEGGSVLRGPAGFTTRVPGLSAAQPGVTSFTWETPEAVAVEVELQLQCIALNGLSATGLPITIQWQVAQHALGAVAYDYPNPPDQYGEASWPMLARGVRVRFPARSFRLQLSNSDAGSVLGPTIRASVQPVLSSSGLIPFPLMHFRQATGAAIARPPVFPIGANEVRFNAYAVDPAITIDFLDFNQAVLIAGLPIGSLEDWRVIPAAAAYWWPRNNAAITNLRVSAAYR